MIDIFVNVQRQFKRLALFPRLAPVPYNRYQNGARWMSKVTIYPFDNAVPLWVDRNTDRIFNIQVD